MNKNDLVTAVSGSAGLSKVDSAKAVDSVFDSITGSLKGGNEVRLVGFGTFSVANRKHLKAAIRGPERKYKFRRHVSPSSKRAKRSRTRLTNSTLQGITSKTGCPWAAGSLLGTMLQQPKVWVNCV